MTSNTVPGTGDVAEAPSYQERVADEQGVGDTIAQLGPDVSDERLVRELLRLDRSTFRSARLDVRRYVQDDGITYGATGESGQARAWHVDPLPVVLQAEEWTSLERGLRQRAEVLRLLYDDLYSEQRLVREGVLQPAAVLGHPGYVRPAMGIPSERRPLSIFATDLGRDADGTWNVLSDRTQAPSGAGYAMATRRIVARILPRLHRATEMSTLLSFFHVMSRAVLQAAPPSDGPPSAVMLSPGAYSETAFDQAFTASLLGIPLVEADDLVVRDGKPWMRASHGLVPVDVVLRRVDELYSDPLDLRGDSQLGVPGLLESSRLGNAAILNPIGAGVLENGAVTARFREITKALVGEEPLLRTPDTWWCGEASGLSHVLANLDQLVVKAVSRAGGVRLVEGRTLSRDELAELRARIEAEPWAWVGQEPLSLSASPVVTDTGLEQRNFVLRTFGVQLDGDHVVMRGGLGRVSTTADERVISNERGALAKDVWVLGKDAAEGYRWVGGTPQRATSQTRGALFQTTPRGADNLYWFGRYTERADGMTRLLAVANDLAADHSMHTGTPGATAVDIVLGAIRQLNGLRPIGDGESVMDYLRDLVTAPAPNGTIRASVGRVVRAAQIVRELVSGDTWAVLASLERAATDIPDESDDLQPHFEALLGPLLALQGLTAHGMFRDTTWAFVDTGIRMERAQFVVALLQHLLGVNASPVVEYHLTEAALAVGDSTISHRRRVAAANGPSVHVESMLDLLIVDRGNPRSVAFQLECIAQNLEVIGDMELAEASSALGARVSWLDLARITDDREALCAEFRATSQELREISDRLGARHFTRQAPHVAFQQRWSPSERWM